MTAPTPTLADFLLAQLAADEAAALVAMGKERTYFAYGDTAFEATVEMADGEGCDPRALAHMRRHDPARVLADVKAKRFLVGEAQLLSDLPGATGKVGRSTLRTLAQPYRGADGWQESWNE